MCVTLLTYLLASYYLPDVEQRVLPTAKLVEALPPRLASVALAIAAAAAAAAAGGSAIAQLAREESK